jgi:phage terminase small subunit
MTPKQQRFCYEYMIDLNATKSAIRAGYSERTANKIASELLKNKEIKEKIEQLKEEQQKKLEITLDTVLKEIAVIAFSPLGKIKTSDKLKALITLTDFLNNPYKELSNIYDDKVIIIDNIKDTNIETKSNDFNVDI